MTTNDHVPELLDLFKALGDKSRLRIVGLLAERPRAVEEIAKALKLGASTVSHHLSVLAKSGIVSGKVQGYYNIYSLDSGPIEELKKRLLTHEGIKGFVPDGAEGEFEKKVMQAFTTPDGKIKAFPVQEKKYLVLLRYVLREFKPGIRYGEKRVNEILSRFSRDTAKLRRSLVEYKFMEREGGGGEYWIAPVQSTILN